MIGYIYTIKNTVNLKQYVGQTINPKRRWIKHKSALKHLTHDSKHLQRAWNLYGFSSFVFNIIETVDFTHKKQLTQRERFWIKKLKSCNSNFGYNINPAGDSQLGRKHSEKTKNKISQANRFGQRKTILSVAQIIEIKHLLKTGIVSHIAKKFNISRSLIQHIKRGDMASYIAPDIELKHIRNYCGENHFKTKLTITQVREIKKLLGSTRIRICDIAKTYKVKGPTIAAIRDGRTWKNI